MIVTVNPNTGIDYTLVAPRFRLNATLRATERAWGMGGKAVDVAWVLGQLGEAVLALGFAAGPNGQRMEQMLQAYGVRTGFVAADGETRLNLVLVSAEEGGQSTITSPGLSVRPAHLEALAAGYTAALAQADCVVIGGSLPEGAPLELYPQLIRQARAHGRPVVFDSSGPALQAGLAAGPSLIKPNRDELGELMGAPPTGLAGAARAARQLQARYGCDVIVTLGREGALAVLGAAAYHVPPVSVPVASTAGAGDGVLAGVALAYAKGLPLTAGLRHGFALAGAILQTLPTAGFRLADYRALLPQVQVIPYPG